MGLVQLRNGRPSQPGTQQPHSLGKVWRETCHLTREGLAVYIIISESEGHPIAERLRLPGHLSLGLSDTPVVAQAYISLNDTPVVVPNYVGILYLYSIVCPSITALVLQ